MTDELQELLKWLFATKNNALTGMEIPVFELCGDRGGNHSLVGLDIYSEQRAAEICLVISEPGESDKSNWLEKEVVK